MSLAEFSPQPHEFELTPPQLQALDAIEAARSQGVTKGYLDMATGSGKTLVAAHCTKTFLNDNPGGRVLYLSHKGSILRQAQDTFSSVLDIDSHGNFFGGEYQDQEQIVYATFQSMARKLGGGRVYEAFDKDEFKFIVVDESHHGPANTYKPVIEYFNPDELLGLTPTPERRDQRDLKEIFGSPIYRLGLEEAIAKGYLAKPDYRLMADNVRRLEIKDEQIGNLSIKEITKTLFIPKREEEIAAEILRQMSEIEDPRAVIFCPGIEYSEKMSKLLPVNSRTLHSKLSQDVQDNRLSQFKSGEISTLLVVDQLNEGVDVPEINFMVFLRATESRTIFLQQLGRGLRKIPGKDIVRILDFAGSWDRIRMVKDLEQTVSEHYDKKPQEFRTIDQPFEFNFSDEAYNAIQIIEKARDAKKTKPQPIEKPRVKLHAEIDIKIKEMLGIETLPNQRMSSYEYEMYGNKIAAGDEAAKQEFIMRRLRHVYGVAAGYSTDLGLTTEDYFQIGLEGLIDAAESYDPKKHSSFKTHANMSVWRFLGKSSRESGLIKPTQSALKQFYELGKAEEKLEKESGFVPTIEQIAAEMGLDINEATVLINERDKFGYNSFQPIEAATNIKDDDAAILLYEGTEEHEMRNALRDALESLSYRERRVLELRYGLGSEHPRNLDEVGKVFNVTRERIRQLENTSLKKLQSLAEAQQLREPYFISSAEGVRMDQLRDQEDRNWREAIEIAKGNPQRKNAVGAILRYLQITPDERERLRRIGITIERQKSEEALTRQQTQDELQDFADRLRFIRNIRSARQYRSRQVMKDIESYITKKNNPGLWELLDEKD